jgi:hypothetical protein
LKKHYHSFLPISQQGEITRKTGCQKKEKCNKYSCFSTVNRGRSMGQ